jgi:hypothetical protein
VRLIVLPIMHTTSPDDDEVRAAVRKLLAAIVRNPRTDGVRRAALRYSQRWHCRSRPPGPVRESLVIALAAR